MKRVHLFPLLAAWALMSSVCSLKADDEDKARLFNTFYLDGEHVSYVLILRQDRSFDLYGPGGDHVAGRLKADDKHFSLVSGDVRRVFKYDIKGADLKLERRENDVLVKGNVLGEMPPTSKSHLLYISEREWRRTGRPAFAIPATAGVAEPAATGTVARPITEAPVTAPQVAAAPAVPIKNSFEDLVGKYYLGGGQAIDNLDIDADGRFVFTRSDGIVEKGTLQRTGSELTFLSANYKRNFDARRVSSGLELNRRETDVIKNDDVLGSMPPQQRGPLVWPAMGDIAGLKTPPPASPAPSSPGIQSLITENGTIAPPPPGTRSIPVESAAAPVKSAKELTGTHVSRPNAFVSETLTFSDDGTFTYKDSTGGAASGTFAVDNGALVLTSGEVERHLAASIGGGFLTLTRTETDTPKLKNDLATLSPTVQKSARYESKQ